MIMDEVLVQTIRWAFIILLAGFIGYFGRYAAMEIIKKFKKEDEKKAVSDKEAKYKYKLEKKKLKVKKKRLKNK
jgi:hypothetical protein